MTREEYIKYFTHMQDEDQKCMLGGMAWDDIGWHIHRSVNEDKSIYNKGITRYVSEIAWTYQRKIEGEQRHMLKVSEVVKYIEGLYNIELMDYQKDFGKHVIAGDVIYTPRCFGRSILYDGYATYLKNVVGKTTDYSVDPLDFDKVYTCKNISENTLIDKKRIDQWQMENPKNFAKEFECKY